MNVLVDAFNQTHKDVTVKLGAVPGGQAAYEKIQTAVKAGVGPDVAMVEYQEIPTLAAAGVLQDVTSLTSKYKAEFQPAAWKEAGFLGKQYGLPHDLGPMVMYYNNSLFQKAGIPVPTTWAEFQSEAATLKQKTGAAMGSYLNYGLFLEAISAQAGAHWFGTAGNSWQVAINDASSKKALNYWTDLTTSGEAIMDKGFNAGYWSDLDSGKIATYITGAWGYRGLEGNLKATSGDWKVALVPQWDASHPVNASIGGSVTAVMKGAKYPDAAIEFAKWLTTDPAAFKLAYQNSGFYPATVNGASLPEYSTPDPFLGGQKVGAVYAKAASQVDSSWQWGPVMTSLNLQLQDALPKSLQAGSANSMLDTIQNQTVSDMKAAGFGVTKG
ncbi:MAG TPA: extracellular solute-binding protein [Pseudolysinimonas sp.]|nr:extracellular solute-binding protein [Pseudolysinimonas sp.]